MDFAALDSMTLEQMQAEFVDLGHQVSAIGVRRQALLAAMSRLKADASARASVARMSDAEKAALKAALDEDTP